MNPEYELAIHLAGKQAIPNLLGLRNISSRQNLLLTSDTTNYTSDRLKKIKPEKKFNTVQLKDPFDFNDIVKTVKKHIVHIDGPIAINLTGGTKPMSIGALLGAFERSGTTVFHYFDSQNDRHIFWEKENEIETKPIDKTLNIDDFITLSEFNNSQKGVDMDVVEKRQDVTRRIWQYIDPFTRNGTSSSIQHAAQECLEKLNDRRNNYNGDNGKDFQATNTCNHKSVSVDYVNGQVLSFKFDDKAIQKPERLDLGYLAGRWLEEFTYLTLLPLLKSEKLKELRLGMRVMFDHKEGKPAQEFDLLATDGLRLWILECKAGVIEMKNLDKLENITLKFAGAQGLGLLVSRWPLNENNDKSLPNIERTLKSNQYAFIGGADLEKDLRENFLKIKAGDIIQTIKR